MEIISIILIIFALFAWSRAILNYKKKRLSINEFVFWTIVWFLVILVSLLPAIFSEFAELIGIQSGINLLIYVSIVLLFYLMYRLYVKTKQTHQELTKIVRNIAIQKRKR
ncbi:DUF2304 family protein [Candidatus Woesearchaeota archaeon]|nr:DUF2304 family protein [Candidatus Woesearchaeota archaeon]